MSTKTLSIRMSTESYDFLSSLARQERMDVSKKVRELVELGRIMLAIEKYKASDASLERAARIAGVSVAKMMHILAEHGVQANIDFEDYLASIEHLGQVW